MGLIGVEGRKKDRLKDIERVKSHAGQICKKYLPGTSNAPSESQFLSQWQKYIEEIGDTFGSHRDYRLAFNLGVRTVLTYQKEFGWTVTPPSYLVTNKPRAQLRTFSWLKTAWKIHQFYENWFNSFLVTSSPKSLSEAYRNLMLSFIFHSGHCIPEVVKAFNQQLVDQTFLLQRWSEIPFITVTVDGSSFNTNVNIDDQQVTQYHCYLHPITQGLLRVWKRWRKEYWDCPNDWDEIKQVLGQGELTYPISELCSAAVYTCEQHAGVEMSQAMVEYQIGRTKSYGLPVSNLARLCEPVVSRLTDIRYHASSRKASDSESSPKRTPSQSDVYRAIKGCLYQDKLSEKLSVKTVKERLLKLMEELKTSQQKDELLLVHWYYHKLIGGRGVSTLKRYHSELTRKWLYLCSQQTLCELSSDDLEMIYKQSIDSISTIKSKKYFAGRLKDLHSFGVTYYGFSPITTQYLHTDPTQAHTRAGFVDEPLFVALLGSIDSACDLNSADKLALKVLCILSYRCGLRLAELKKLKINDIENSKIGRVSVRDNNIGSNKTASSLRKVPLYPLLFDMEKKLVDSYFHIKLGQERKNKPFLTIGTDDTLPINTLQVSTFIGSLLKSLSLLDHLVFYHLRHSCFSRIQLIVELDKELDDYPYLVAYGCKQRRKISRLLCGDSFKNAYDGIAAFAGHESADMTFQHYFHFSDWIVAKKLGKAKYLLDKTKTHILGLETRRKLTESQALATPSDVQAYLISALNVEKLSNPISDGVVKLKLKSTSAASHISIPICYQALSLYQEGFQLEEICHRFKISEEILNRWIANAKVIKAITASSRGKEYSRHFSSARANKLLPAQLKADTELKRLNQYVKNLKEHYKSNRERLTEAFLYALNHTSTSHSGIYFNEPETLKTFIETCHLFIPKSHWRAMTHFMGSSIAKEEWEQALIGIKHKTERQASGRSKKSRGAVRLELIHSVYQVNTGNEISKKQSSPALIYLFHMMGIMMLHY
jgi:integrase